MTDKTGKSFQITNKDMVVVDNFAETPSIFIDGMVGVMHGGGMIRVGLYQVTHEIGGADDASAVKRLVVGRLVMTPSAMVGLSRWLSQQVKDMALDQKPSE